MPTFTHSPALSAIDSLADIDDLDSFLDAQGQLSHWPTPPPPKEDITISEIEVESDDDSDNDEDFDSDDDSACDYDYSPMAKILTQEARSGTEFDHLDAELVQKVLDNAQLPTELLALAFNILQGLNEREVSAEHFRGATSDLLVASALGLAVSYTDDHLVSFTHWSRAVCSGLWTGRRIDKTILQILDALDWRLHKYSSPAALEETMVVFRAIGKVCAGRALPPIQIPELPAERREPGCEVPAPPRLVINSSSVHWANGQITPDETPPGSAMEQAEECFLPLL